MRTACAESVQRLYDNQFAGNQLRFGEPGGRRERFLVKTIRRIEYRNPEYRIDKRAPHSNLRDP